MQASQAALDKAVAAFDLASQHARRIATLTGQRAAPEAENEKAIGAQRQAEAEVGSRKADVARAKLNLDYATIRAPISGVVGAALASEGALVVQNETTSLATIQQLDPIYADFTQSVSEMHKLRRAFDNGDGTVDGDHRRSRDLFQRIIKPLDGRPVGAVAALLARVARVHRDPREPRLKSLETQLLEELSISVKWATPLLIVILRVFGVCTHPSAARDAIVTVTDVAHDRCSMPS